MKHAELSARVIGACIKVHEELGPGLLESIYESALCHELSTAGIKYKRQVEIGVIYDGIDLGMGFRADVIVENKILLELKSVESITKVYAKTVMTYMRMTSLEVGLLINFNVELLKEGITRISNETWNSKYGKNVL